MIGRSEDDEDAMDVDNAPKQKKQKKKKALKTKKPVDDLSEYKLDDYDEEETDAGAYPPSLLAPSRSL